ncbi:MAG TPA: hypothetical protein DCS93_00330 [Microscillaceae bacterium]|nr:hypothetical protein [Microscillaceae bacterium]
MTNAHNEIDQHTIVTWLESKKYDLVLAKHQHFIRKKVVDYIQGFRYYHQFESDFYHDVYIYLRTQSLPSKAFLEACRTQNMFKFYLAKCIRNRLNTLLSKERDKRMHTTTLEGLLGNQDDFQTIETDKSHTMAKNAYRSDAEFEDIKQRLHQQLQSILHQFIDSLPQVGYKLVLMLKVQARADVYEEDLRRCFGKVRSKDTKALLSLLNGSQYRQQKDIGLIQKLAPYFKKYRKEKGDAKALQRWVNQYIAGDKYTKGIIDRLTISDANYDFKIQSKRWFLDFVYEHFKNLEEGKIPEASIIPIYYKRAPQPNTHQPLKFQQG